MRGGLGLCGSSGRRDSRQRAPGRETFGFPDADKSSPSVDESPAHGVFHSGFFTHEPLQGRHLHSIGAHTAPGNMMAVVIQRPLAYRPHIELLIQTDFRKMFPHPTEDLFGRRKLCVLEIFGNGVKGEMFRLGNLYNIETTRRPMGRHPFDGVVVKPYVQVTALEHK